ncbi:MAG: CpsB/CapC family capsule biosynthesis tyrosine phosphatase [Myxococcales bacterium]
MAGFVDLHCHWVSGIDDGARTPELGLMMLSRLKQAGFEVVMATPHMRPGLFDNDKRALERAYAAMLPHLEQSSKPLPRVHLASEHFFDDVVYRRILQGEGLAYPGGRAVLVEFGTHWPLQVEHRLADVERAGFTPVLAHPERYGAVWKDPQCLEPLLDLGVHLLLDVAALIGKYGRTVQHVAERLLADDLYEAACSDAHRPEDVDDVVIALGRLGAKEANRLLAEGPRVILGEGPI